MYIFELSRGRFAGFLLPLLAATLSLAACGSTWGAEQSRRPNVILILADDLGYAELGCYGQKKIRTPCLDRLAEQGQRFTQFYAGSPVCAPSRCVLMTGKHGGHAFIRNNTEVKPEGQQPLPAETATLARLLQAAGYATGMVGKWGLGPPGSTGDPLRQGFDFFFGYNCQRHAHNHYPKYLWKNEQRVPLEGNDAGPTGKHYTQDLFEQEALAFIKKHRERPFFLYLPFTIPHLALQVPEDSLAEYQGKWDDPPYKGGKGYIAHEQPRAAYAAMVTRMDRTVGRLVALLRELGIEDDTLILFSSDNGPTHGGVGGSDSIFFASAGRLRGFKGSVFEGGLRVPLIAYWRQRIRPGGTPDLPCASYDLLPTICALAGANPPQDSDGLSLVPTLLGQGEQKRHPYLYWEFFGYGGQQAVRLGDWKAVRVNMHKGNRQFQLFNLREDEGETRDLAEQHPDILRRIEAISAEVHTPSTLYPFKILDKK